MPPAAVFYNDMATGPNRGRLSQQHPRERHDHDDEVLTVNMDIGLITVAVIGASGATPVAAGIAIAGGVLQVVRGHPRRPILLRVDTQGQRLHHRDELLGINSYLAHLATGAIEALWEGRLNQHLAAALTAPFAGDRRRVRESARD